jgi:hypothetical protein
MQEPTYFEWDSHKAKQNFRKHGISFDLAKQIFRDTFLKLELEGYDHGEERWRAIGQIGRSILIVSCTIREEEGCEIVRLISARNAHPQERRRYEGNS